MGYNLYITRADDWVENEGCQIPVREWLDVVAADPELRLDPVNGPYDALWNGPSEHEEPWFDWSEGNVYTKNPDPPMIEKMVELAAKLGGKV